MKPSYDSIYLASRINERSATTSLTPSGLQRLVNTYGAVAVEDALRSIWGFPPKELRRPYPYLVAILKEQS